MKLRATPPKRGIMGNKVTKVLISFFGPSPNNYEQETLVLMIAFLPTRKPLPHELLERRDGSAVTIATLDRAARELQRQIDGFDKMTMLTLGNVSKMQRVFEGGKRMLLPIYHLEDVEPIQEKLKRDLEEFMDNLDLVKNLLKAEDANSGRSKTKPRNEREQRVAYVAAQFYIFGKKAPPTMFKRKRKPRLGSYHQLMVELWKVFGFEVSSLERACEPAVRKTKNKH